MNEAKQLLLTSVSSTGIRTLLLPLVEAIIVLPDLRLDLLRLCLKRERRSKREDNANKHETVDTDQLNRSLTETPSSEQGCAHTTQLRSQLGKTCTDLKRIAYPVSTPDEQYITTQLSIPRLLAILEHCSEQR